VSYLKWFNAYLALCEAPVSTASATKRMRRRRKQRRRARQRRK
jgi:hypothetical protein